MQYGFIGLFTFLYIIGAFVSDEKEYNEMLQAIGGIILTILLAAAFCTIDN
jgi:hypothetical protein